MRGSLGRRPWKGHRIYTAIMRQSSEEGVIEGLNFAVPITDLKKVLDQLVALVK